MRKLKVAIVGGGIGGLSAGFYLKNHLGRDLELSVYEKASQLGGTIGITREKGYLADWGPNGFLDREQLTLDFVDDAGLTEKLQPANDQSEKRFILRGGRLREIKAHPIKFMTSDLLTIRGRLRLLKEIFVPAKRDGRDETIFDFAARRIGREAAEILIDPMVTGIFGGDARKLSLSACFGKMEAMEREHGSLFKAMIALKKQKKAERKKDGGPAGPGGRLTSFQGGFYTLVEQLEKHLSGTINLDCGVTALRKTGDGRMEVSTDNGSYVFDRVILAVPAYVAAKLLSELYPQTSEQLAQIPYCGLAVVCHGYRIGDINRDLDGFGFLIPRSENRNILGSIWTSVIFPDQAPEGEVLLRTMLGGARQPEMAELPPDTLAQIAHGEMSDIMGIRHSAVFEKTIVWPRAIPQYLLGHKQSVSEIESTLADDGLIHLAGNAYSGVGLNDVIKRSHDIVTGKKYYEHTTDK